MLVTFSTFPTGQVQPSMRGSDGQPINPEQPGIPKGLDNPMMWSQMGQGRGMGGPGMASMGSGGPLGSGPMGPMGPGGSTGPGMSMGPGMPMGPGGSMGLGGPMGPGPMNPMRPGGPAGGAGLMGQAPGTDRSPFGFGFSGPGGNPPPGGLGNAPPMFPPF